MRDLRLRAAADSHGRAVAVRGHAYCGVQIGVHENRAVELHVRIGRQQSRQLVVTPLVEMVGEAAMQIADRAHVVGVIAPRGRRDGRRGERGGNRRAGLPEERSSPDECGFHVSFGP